jgi:BioD-like phosphotransacetylase family protein
MGQVLHRSATTAEAATNANRPTVTAADQHPFEKVIQCVSQNSDGSAILSALESAASASSCEFSLAEAS